MYQKGILTDCDKTDCYTHDKGIVQNMDNDGMLNREGLNEENNPREVHPRIYCIVINTQ